MSALRRILVAASGVGIGELATTLQRQTVRGEIDCAYAATFDQAADGLGKEHFELVIVGECFDGGKPVNLISYLAENYPQVPVLLVRPLGVSGGVTRTADIAHADLGAIEFFDLVGQTEKLGSEAAKKAFGEAVTRQLSRSSVSIRPDK